MSNKKQSSIDFLIEQIEIILKLNNVKLNAGYTIHTILPIIEKLKAMQKEEVKMIIEHYHNNMFYLKLTEKELKNITEIIYDKIFGGQDNE